MNYNQTQTNKNERKTNKQMHFNNAHKSYKMV